MFKLKGASQFGGALVIGRLIQAGAFFAMARQLQGDQMGVVALLTALFIGLFQLTNLGLDRYVVYTKATEPEDLALTIDVVWTLQLLRGVFVLLCTIPVGMAVNRFSAFDLTYAYFLGIALSVMILSVANPKVSTFERTGDFNYIGRMRAFSVAAGGLTTIGLVFVFAEPWVYVAGQIASACVFTGLSFLYSDGRPRLSLDGRRIREALKYCKHLIVVAAVSFISTQLESFYVGVAFGPASLGLYFTWNRMVHLPREILTQLLSRILFSKVSDLARRDQPFNRSHVLGFAAIVGLVLPFNTFIWFHGDVLMVALAGERWVGFWWGGRIFALISTAYALLATIGPFNLVTCPWVSSTLRSIETAAMACLMFLLAPVYGIAGVLSALLSVLTIALMIRIVVLYRWIITSGRATHAATCVTILTVTLAPLLVVEFLILPWLGMDDLVAPAAAYAATCLTIGGAAVLNRRQLLQGIS